MGIIKVLKALINGDLVVVVKGDENKFSYFKGANVNRKFILNSFSEIIKLNI